jgi:hypothetical protein
VAVVGRPVGSPTPSPLTCDGEEQQAAASRGEMRTATALLALLMSAMLVAGTASTGGSATGTASTTAAPGAAARQEAQVLGEVLGRLRSLEGEMARLAVVRA